MQRSGEGHARASVSRCSIVQGGLDTQVEPHNADRLEALARKREERSRRSTVVKVPGVNHLLVPATTGEVDEYRDSAGQARQSARDSGDRRVAEEDALERVRPWVRADVERTRSFCRVRSRHRRRAAAPLRRAGPDSGSCRFGCWPRCSRSRARSSREPTSRRGSGDPTPSSTPPPGSIPPWPSFARPLATQPSSRRSLKPFRSAAIDSSAGSNRRCHPAPPLAKRAPILRPPASAMGQPTILVPTSARDNRRWGIGLAVAAAIIAFVATTAYQLRADRSRVRVAVVLFDNETGRPEMARFAQGSHRRGSDRADRATRARGRRQRGGPANRASVPGHREGPRRSQRRLHRHRPGADARQRNHRAGPPDPRQGQKRTCGSTSRRSTTARPRFEADVAGKIRAAVEERVIARQ